MNSVIDPAKLDQECKTTEVTENTEDEEKEISVFSVTSVVKKNRIDFSHINLNFIAVYLRMILDMLQRLAGDFGPIIINQYPGGIV